MKPAFSLIVIKSPQPEALKAFYECLGWEFVEEQHGKGPVHFAAESEGMVFELYPLPEETPGAADSMRLGFHVVNLEGAIAQLRNTGFRILQEPCERPWGRIAVAQDPDGRKVELAQR